MEVTNELLTKIYGLYIGCEVRVKHQELANFNFTDTLIGIQGKTLGKVESRVQTKNGAYAYPFDACKLLLKPLSSITDEDKVGLCKILYPENENWSVNMHEADNCDSFLQSLHDIEEYHLFGIKYPMQKSIEAIDYLRSKGYMLPAYGITDLFEAGIAIDPSTLTDKSK